MLNEFALAPDVLAATAEWMRCEGEAERWGQRRMSGRNKRKLNVGDGVPFVAVAVIIGTGTVAVIAVLVGMVVAALVGMVVAVLVAVFVGMLVGIGVAAGVIVAAVLSALPAELLTRTQYCAVAVTLRTLNVLLVAPLTGWLVSPDAPRYHW